MCIKHWKTQATYKTVHQCSKKVSAKIAEMLFKKLYICICIHTCDNYIVMENFKAGLDLKYIPWLLNIAGNDIQANVWILKDRDTSETLPGHSPKHIGWVREEHWLQEQPRGPWWELQISTAELGDAVDRKTFSHALQEPGFYGRVAKRKQLLKEGLLDTPCSFLEAMQLTKGNMEKAANNLPAKTAFYFSSSWEERLLKVDEKFDGAWNWAIE